MTKSAPGKEIDATLLVTAKNPRGIPQVVFIVSLKATAWSFEESSSLYKKNSRGTQKCSCVCCVLCACALMRVDG